MYPSPTQPSLPAATPAPSDDNAPDVPARVRMGWALLMLLTAAGSASAATLMDTAAPLFIVIGLACLVRLEQAWRP